MRVCGFFGSCFSVPSGFFGQLFSVPRTPRIKHQLNEQHVAQQLPPKCYAAAENITILAPNNSIGDWALQIVIDSWRRKLWSAAVQLFSISHRTLVAYPIVPNKLSLNKSGLLVFFFDPTTVRLACCLG